MNGKCDENAECTKNSSGVISCTCFKGYNGDGYNCSSPCVNDNGGCHDNATCSYSVSIAICPFIACWISYVLGVKSVFSCRCLF